MKLYKPLALCILCITAISISGFAQNVDLDFFEKEVITKNEEDSKHRIVYFKLINIDSESEQTKVRDILSNDPGVFNIKIKDLGNCYAEIDKTISPQYIRDLISSENVDFDFTSIKIINPSAICSELPEDFPVFNDTGRPQSDKQNYQEKLTNWIENNIDIWDNCIIF